MEKRVIVEFSEQSKAVVANVRVEYNGEDIPPNDSILFETQKLFEEAQRYALNKSLLRNK